MSRYTAISNDIWSDREFRKLSPVGKNVYLFILTNPQGNQAGMYRLSLDLVEFYLGKDAVDEMLTGSPLYKYDKENEVVLIPNYLKYNIAKSNQQLQGVARCVASIPYCTLVVDWMESFIRYTGEDSVKYLPASMREYACIRAKKEGRERLFQAITNYAFY